MTERKKEIIELEKESPKYKGEAIEATESHTLKSVREEPRINRAGKKTNCLYLDFEEDVPTRKRDEWNDRNGFMEMKSKAESLIGRKVITTTWKPKEFRPLEWWRNIYEAD